MSKINLVNAADITPVNANANEMQSAVALWIEAEGTKGSADVAALAAMTHLVGERYLVPVKDKQVTVTLADAVTHDNAKVRAAAKNGFFVAFGGFEPGQEIPGACLSGFNRVIRAALFLASKGVSPAVVPITGDGKTTTALANIPLSLASAEPLIDESGKPTPDFADIIAREVEFYADKGEPRTTERVTADLLASPVTLHKSYTRKGALKPFTTFAKDMSAQAVTEGLVPAPHKRDTKRTDDEGASFMAALALVSKVMQEVTESDESAFAFTVQIDADLVALALMIEKHAA